MGWQVLEYAGPGPLASSTDRTGVIRRADATFTSQAFRGEAGDSGFNLDDLAASRTFPLLKMWSLTEDASGSPKFIWVGRMNRSLTRRGDHRPGDARQFQHSFVDANWDIRKLRVHNWDRPAETDVARVQALGAYILNGAASTVTNARKRPSTVIDVATYVPNTNTVLLDPRTYDGTDPWGVLDDVGASSGKEWFVYVGDDGTRYLFYDTNDSIALVSPIAITDVDPDLDTSFPPELPLTTGDVDSSDYISGGAHLWGDGAAVTYHDAAAEAAQDVAEDTLYDSAETEAAALARLTELVDERKVPERRIETAIFLPPEKLHLVKPGMLISFRAAAASVTTPVDLRIRRADRTPPPGRPDGPWYIKLELAYPKRMRPRLRDRGRMQVIARQLAPSRDAEASVVTCSGVSSSESLYATAIVNGITGAWGVNPEPPCGMYHPTQVSNACGAGDDLLIGEGIRYAGIRYDLGGGCTGGGELYGEFTYDWHVDTGIGEPNIHPVNGPFAIIAYGYTPAGAPPSITDILAGGVQIGTFEGSRNAGSSGATDGIEGPFRVPLSMLKIGTGSVIFVIAPLYRISPTNCAGGTVSPDGGYHKAQSASSLVVKRLATGTSGWVVAPIDGTQDGTTKSYALEGGYDEVSDVWLNGVSLPPSEWSATNGTNLDLLSAPIATDLVEARWFVPA